MEALGYLGGALAIVAGFIAVRELWPGIPVAAQLALAGTAAVALGAAAALMRPGADAALARLRSVLWVMSAAGLAAFTGVLADSAWHFSITGTVTLAAAVTTVYTAVVWMRTRTALQELAVFVAADTTVGAGIALAGPGSGGLGPGPWRVGSRGVVGRGRVTGLRRPARDRLRDRQHRAARDRRHGPDRNRAPDRGQIPAKLRGGAGGGLPDRPCAARSRALAVAMAKIALAVLFVPS